MITVTIIVGVLMAAAIAMVLRRDLMMFQQNSYRYDRFRHWMKEEGESTTFPRLFAMILGMLACVRHFPKLPAIIIIGIFALYMLLRLGVAKYKKPLVMTKRATRIYVVAVALVVAINAAIWLITEDLTAIPICLILFFAVSYGFITVANWLLSPYEKHLNKKYYNEAASILASMPQLKVIGVTGSYGKTSTKHYLNRILSEQFDVLMTPGNFNTTLGVIRTVREHMKPYNEIFIAEMGAKQIGDIKEICDLVHPTIGIITAVGPQHLESFKTMENVQATKFELADALPTDGLAVVNNDFDFIADRPVDNARCLRYAVSPLRAADYHAKDITYTPQGTYFTIADADGDVISLHTRLVGECNVSNLMAAVIVALRLGMDTDKIRYAVEQIEQVEHRLSIKQTPAGVTIIDDAYNSNPVGSKMALDVLSGMNTGKRIVVTPGMIELGSDQIDLNKELGRTIAHSVDVAIIVGRYNRDAIVEGIRQEGLDDSKVMIVDTFAQAQERLASILKPGDVVLYENDLPDTFK